MAIWEGVSEFVAVAESNSFTGAAKKLNTSVAQVSRRVAALEDRLAVKLLHRTTRKVTLSEAGQVYFEQCKLLVEGLELAELAVTQLQTAPKGKLKITAPVTYGEMHIAPLLHEFLLRYPQLDLTLDLSNQTVDLIEGGFDVAIRLGRLRDSTLIAKRLASRQLYVCASPDYIQRYGAPHTLSELSHHQCLVGSVEYWHFKEKTSEKSLRVSGRIRCNSGFALLDAAKRGLGLVQLPDYYVQAGLDSGELIEVLKEYRDEREGIWALYPQNRNLSPKVRLLIDFLVEKMAE
ncbi:LysR family transcriptional regulator [Vibrio renipiscarius]|uniref:LysR family transcriptional regulator n=1 Tax=Vibrio renipiscarius TaxID=1461322 RepID=A0A0C2NUT2_9VIBR|nr:LysR family transcriptional regulator [Vibrio renipiscarius]KII76557.1 LysR family transcriptional regulator [Vibrio renipiscarius]KII77922.1 LysR family transcriptional regulator [Vibrio renipiscarius]